MGFIDSIMRVFRINGVRVNHHSSFRAQNNQINSINSASIYLNSIYARLSTDISKLSLRHIKEIVSEDDTIISEVQYRSDIQYVLTVSPNEYSTPIEFWNDIATEFLINKYAVVMPIYHQGRLKSLTLVKEFETDISGDELYFIIKNRRFHYRELLVFKDVNSQLRTGLSVISSLIDTSLSALNAKLSSGNRGLMGLLKIPTRADDEELLAAAKSRINHITDVASSNSSGIGFLQQGEEFQELTKKIEVASTEELEFLKRQLYENFGINQNILNSSYSEHEYNAYFQSIILPYQTMIVQELNKKLFTKTALSQGNKIMPYHNILEFATLESKANALQKLKYVGMVTANEGRQILGLGSYPGGDRFETNANAIQVQPSDSELQSQDS